MHKFATCIEWRDLKLFGVLFKNQFDEQYSNNMPPIVAAISVGGPFFATCVQMMESGDRNYLVIYSRYAPFHGACAYHILKNHDFLIDEYREQVFNALERTKSLYIDVEGETSLFDSIMGCVAYSNATGEDQVIIDSEPEHPAIGSVKQTDDAKPTYEPTKTTSLHDIEASSKVPSEPAEEFAETYWEQLALAEDGDADAQFNLGLMHVNGQGAPIDYSEAVKWYRLAAEQGDADAQTNLGLMHANGQGVPIDYSEAVKWYRLAAEQGNATAQSNLALMHFDGQGVPQDFVLAHMWYNLSAANGDEDGVEGRALVAAQMTPTAIEEAQRLFSEWDGSPDVQVASKTSEPAEEFAETYWEQLALAEDGDADAQFNLGLMHVNGQGAPIDYSEAVKWYRLAAEQGDADAQTNLGLMHANGQGVPIDYSEAVKWYRLAAEQGNATAQSNLALMHFDGQGVPQDFVLAHMWYNLSAANGDEDGVEGRALVAAQMTPTAIEEAQRRARASMASNYQDYD